MSLTKKMSVKTDSGRDARKTRKWEGTLVTVSGESAVITKPKVLGKGTQLLNKLA